MKIWLISRYGVPGFDEYSEAVVIAKTADEAKQVHPNGHTEWPWYDLMDPWPCRPEDIKVICLGEASEEALILARKTDVFCASYHAG